MRARCRPGPGFPLSFPEGREAKSPGPGGSVTAPGFFPGGLSFPHQLDAYASFVSQFLVLGEAPALPPHLSLSRLHFSRLVSQGGGGGARGGASSGRLLRNQTTFQDKATPGARHAGGCSRFSRGWAGCLGQGLLGEGAGIPRCSSCSSSLPGQGKHILSTRRATAPGRRVGNWIAPSPTRTAAEEPGKNPEGKMLRESHRPGRGPGSPQKGPALHFPWGSWEQTFPGHELSCCSQGLAPRPAPAAAGASTAPGCALAPCRAAGLGSWVLC